MRARERLMGGAGLLVFLMLCVYVPVWGSEGGTRQGFTLVPDTVDVAEEAERQGQLLVAEAKVSEQVEETSDSDLDEISIAPPEIPEEEEVTIPDPLEPINRIFFVFNDKLYFWFLRPVARGYKKVVPERARVGVRNFFSNLLTPIRLVNCLLQGKFKAAGTETLRFIINSTVGFLGLEDVAKKEGHLSRQDEDLGQSLGVWGLGPGIYINWPILGPSSLRDSLGLIGDAFLDPINYAVTRTKYNIAVRGYDKVNKTSLTLGDYESLKKSAIDPYVAVRDAYFQYRKSQIEK
ncbi:MAG: VacJ family lipoprotein [Deltaproteobacteria bacterium]|nr:VacJ family lipoprotein [Deltaproteobacteria bacterium]MBW1929547.1 VacJ family lipoprotein [Deltaproteobacteria bacterium]MBW2126154.1 VacJ family lipoprotein [Deltaproteobacteria bacterium]